MSATSYYTTNRHDECIKMNEDEHGEEIMAATLSSTSEVDPTVQTEEKLTDETTDETTKNLIENKHTGLESNQSSIVETTDGQIITKDVGATSIYTMRRNFERKNKPMRLVPYDVDSLKNIESKRKSTSTNIIDDLIGNLGADSIHNPTDDSIHNPTDDPTDDPAQNPTENPTDDPIVEPCLHFSFRGNKIPIEYAPGLTHTIVSIAISSELFRQWVRRTSSMTGTKRIDVHSLTIDSVTFFESANDSDSATSDNVEEERDQRVVESMNIRAHCTLNDEDFNLKAKSIPGTCALKFDFVGILAQLICEEDNSRWSLLVDHSSVAIGAVSTLSLPEGTINKESGDILGPVATLVEKVCSVKLNISNMTNLNEVAFGNLPTRTSDNHGLCPSSGSCSEFVQIMSLTKNITREELHSMKSQLSESRDQGQAITIRVVPFTDMWKISTDMKVICATFLMEKIEGSEKRDGPDITGERTSGSGSYRKKLNNLCKDGANRLKGHKHNKQLESNELSTKPKHKRHAAFWKKKHHTKT